MSKNIINLSKEERSELFKKFKTPVKIKLNDATIFEFTPFVYCASLPSQFNIKWLPINNIDKPKCEYILCDKLYHIVKTQGIETDNIEYLQEAGGFETKNLIENLNIDDDRIWLILQNLSNKKNLPNKDNLDNYPIDYKKLLIEGYKIYKSQCYNFTDIEHEHNYFTKYPMENAEKAYYSEFIEIQYTNNISNSKMTFN
jgi:hypothetical protein